MTGRQAFWLIIAGLASGCVADSKKQVTDAQALASKAMTLLEDI